MCQASTCGRVLALARVQVLQNSGSQMVVLRFTPLSSRNCLREHSHIKSSRVVHWCAQCHAKWPRLSRGFQHSSGIEPMSPDSLQPVLTTKPLVCIISFIKTVYGSSYFATCNWFFCVQDCRSRVFQVEYQGQTRNTRIWNSWTQTFDRYVLSHSS